MQSIVSEASEHEDGDMDRDVERVKREDEKDGMLVSKRNAVAK